MNKIKILRILNRFNVGGPIYNAAYLTKYLDNQKYETLLIGGRCCSHEKSAEYILEDLGVEYKKLALMQRSISPIRDILCIFQILYIMYKYKPEIIHTHAAKAGLLGRISALLFFKKKCIVHTYHGNVFDGYFNSLMTRCVLFVERMLGKITSRIIAISESQKNELISKYNICDVNKISIIPLGFDLYKFSESIEEKRGKLRSEINISPDEVLVTIIGRIVPVKNHWLFIDVIKYCKSKSTKKIKALIVGDGEIKKDIMKYAGEVGLKISSNKFDKHSDVLFTSWRSDIDHILAASDIGCLTSINEGTPVSIIESMASGTAAISTDVGGVADIIDDNISGIVCNNDLKKFGDKLLILVEDKKIRDFFAKNGQKKASTKYHYNKLIENMDKLYGSLT